MSLVPPLLGWGVGVGMGVGVGVGVVVEVGGGLIWYLSL